MGCEVREGKEDEKSNFVCRLRQLIVDIKHVARLQYSSGGDFLPLGEA